VSFCGLSDEGLGLKVYDSSITQIAASSEPNDANAGSGNVHNIVQFATGINGEFYIQVVPNNSNVTGDYVFYTSTTTLPLRGIVTMNLITGL
jgi:hypothetical protein